MESEQPAKFEEFEILTLPGFEFRLTNFYALDIASFRQPRAGGMRGGAAWVWVFGPHHPRMFVERDPYWVELLFENKWLPPRNIRRG